jgi:hypothetical protein
MVLGLVERGKVPPHVQPGRPSQVTEEKVAAIIDGVRRGMRPFSAAGLAGVYKQTFHYWLRRGEQLDLDEVDWDRLADSERLYVVLARGVLIAQGEFEARQVARINEAAEEDWHAAKFLVERRLEEWRPAHRSYVEVSVRQAVEAPEPTEERYTTQDRLNALAQMARELPPALPAPPRCAHGISGGVCPTCEPQPPVPRDRGCDAGDHQLNHNRTLCLRCGTGWSRPR